MGDKASAGAAPFPDALHPLTSVRFFLALGVVLFHYQLQWTLPAESAGLLDRARLGVDVFFILSGFILTHVYLQDDRRFSYRAFLVARFARIYPAHVAILLAMLAMVLAARLIGVGLEPGRFNAVDFFGTLFLVQAWFPRETITFWNGPSWSLSAEWFAYLAFPAYAALALRLRHRPWLLIGLSALLFVILDAFYRQAFGRVLPRAEDSMGILRILPEFLYGVGLYYLGRGLKPSPALALWSAVGSTLLLLTAMQLAWDDRLIVVVSGPFLLSLALLSKARIDQPLAHPALLFAGEASYALYLVHHPVLMAWRNLAESIFNLDGDYRMSPLELAAMLSLTLALAALIHVFVERPGRRWLRARLSLKRGVSPAVERRLGRSDQGEPF